MSKLKWIIGALITTILISVGVFAWRSAVDELYESDQFRPLYERNCMICHGERLEGGAQGPPLVARPFTHGESVAEIAKSITDGIPDKQMPAFDGAISDTEIKQLAIFIAERRAGRRFNDFKVDTALNIPKKTLQSEKHAFRIETVISDLAPLPFSIAPLPDGRILLTEKLRGLSVISPGGEQSPLIEGAPTGYADGYTQPLISLYHGIGWILDVAPHPNFEDNGWIYVHYTERCQDCNEASKTSAEPVSMNKLVRGRISDGRWVDEETIWEVPKETYTTMSDMAAGGRIAFDGAGHVFISAGFKGPINYVGIQDLSMPYGKIHRVRDDGAIPPDNPYVGDPGAMDSIWTFGHRSPQGLEFEATTGRLWSTEMGPRGGDELNLILPGRNYGWPLYSLGLDYDGTPVEYGNELGIEFDLADIEQPVFDWTPSPAISSFAIYEGDAFPQWRRSFIVGSLKGTELYRLELEDAKVIQRETLITALARIRDVEVGPDGLVYLLLEHKSGSRIVRLVPDPA